MVPWVCLCSFQLQSLKQQKKDEEGVTKEDEAMERFKNNDTENKVEEMKEKEKWKKKEQTENCTTQEAAEMVKRKDIIIKLNVVLWKGVKISFVI